MITLTDKAAEEINRMRKEMCEENLPLRMAVNPGGCSGLEYGMGFDEKIDGDVEFEINGVKILMDPHSFEHMKGATVNFDDGLHGKGFDISNPNAKSTCGCGKSFN